MCVLIKTMMKNKVGELGMLQSGVPITYIRGKNSPRKRYLITDLKDVSVGSIPPAVERAFLAKEIREQSLRHENCRILREQRPVCGNTGAGTFFVALEEFIIR